MRFITFLIFVAQVYEVDPFDANPSCCIAKHNFSALYPSDEIDGHVDAGYLRWFEKRIYFYHGDYVYSGSLGVPVGENRQDWQTSIQPAPLQKLGRWNEYWRDICDVITPVYNTCFNTDA